MDTISAQIDDELEQKFRSEISKRIGDHRDAIKRAIEEAIKLWLKKRPPPSGAIKKSIFLEGIELCEKNAERLIQEADETFTKGAHTAAFILGFTAWEEAGKAFLFLQNWEKDEILREKWIREFKNHLDKIRLAYEFTQTSHFKRLIRLSPRVRELFFPEGKEESKIKVVMDKKYSKEVFRSRGQVLFVNYNFNNNKFESPSDFVNPSLAANIIGSARDSLNALRIIKNEIITHVS